MTAPMAVRKFAKKYCARGRHEFDYRRIIKNQELDLLIKNNYTVVTNIESQPDMLSDWEYNNGPLLKIVSYPALELWCDQSFRPRHWVYIHDHWAFTHADDATLFRLTWL